jgi:hypothetical protein
MHGIGDPEGLRKTGLTAGMSLRGGARSAAGEEPIDRAEGDGLSEATLRFAVDEFGRPERMLLGGLEKRLLRHVAQGAGAAAVTPRLIFEALHPVEPVGAEPPKDRLKGNRRRLAVQADGREAAAVFLAAYEESRKKSREKSSPATLKKSLRELSEAVEGFRTQVLEWLETTRPGLPEAPPPPPKDDEPHQGRLF